MDADRTVRATRQLPLIGLSFVSSEEAVSYLSAFLSWLNGSPSKLIRDICRGLAAVQINGTAKWGKSGPVFAQST
jgi:hypothetical protein